MTEDERIAIWLDALLNIEMDLRASRGVSKETRLGSNTPRVLILEEGEMAGYAELRRVGGAIELATVVVEPKLRGKGFAHQIVQQAWERWRQDPVLHRVPLGGEIDLMKAAQDDSRPEVVRGPLISFTRDAAMAAALVGGGFTMMPRKRRGSRLWLWKIGLCCIVTMDTDLHCNRSFVPRCHFYAQITQTNSAFHPLLS